MPFQLISGTEIHPCRCNTHRTYLVCVSIPATADRLAAGHPRISGSGITAVDSIAGDNRDVGPRNDTTDAGFDGITFEDEPFLDDVAFLRLRTAPIHSGNHIMRTMLARRSAKPGRSDRRPLPGPARLDRFGRGFVLAFLGSLIASYGTADAAVLTVGQPGDTGCDHYSLQGAIDAAAGAPGLDTLRISVGTYTAQRVMVTDSGDLAIRGGYLNCGTPVANAGTTTLSGDGASPASAVIGHAGNGALTLTDLNVTAGIGSNGGGIFSSTMAKLTLVRVFLYNNRATVGGGLSVVGLAGQQKPVDLLGVAFNSNIATSSGGGLYALNADVRIAGDEVNYFTGNWAQGTAAAQGGGAIYAHNSNVNIHSQAPAQWAFMDDNLATQAGGGAIHFSGSAPGNRYLTIMNRDASRPLVIANNAARKGGAIYVQSGGGGGAISAAATLFNTIIQDNDAVEGGALYIEGSDATHPAVSSVTMLPTTPGQAVSPCPASLRCNRIEGNFTSSSSTVSVNSFSGQGRAGFSIIRGHVTGNHSPNSGVIGGLGFMSTDNSVIANNVLGHANVISNIGDEVRIENSTIANNTFAAPEVLLVALPGGRLTVHNSIVFQPGKQFHTVGTPVVVNLRNLLVNPEHGLDDLFARNIQGNLAPSFIDPGQNDFRLRQ
jgi:predicted outer membrane repeat protein